MMKKTCPNCEKLTSVETINCNETLNVRGEAIEVAVEYLKCLECNESFDDPMSNNDHIEVAYKIYRQRHNMLHPEEMRAYRKKMGLTQGEMAKLLGWGSITLSRYETGALQDETHDRAFRMAMEPEGLLKLIEITPEALNEKKKERLCSELLEIERGLYSPEIWLKEKAGSCEPSILSGYKCLNVQKLLNVILFFCKGGVFKTKLNKLLYYADNIHYRDSATSITGARYCHDHYGPVPENFESYHAFLKNSLNAIDLKEEIFPGGYSGENIFSTKDPDLSLFSDSEINTLSAVKEYFKDFNSKQISDLSHNDKGYVETKLKENISYEYAEQIQILK